MAAILSQPQHVNLLTLWPSDTMWRQTSRLTLAQVMAWCLTAPSHNWTNVDWPSVKSKDIHIRAISQEMPQTSITKIQFENCISKISLKFPRGQWVNIWYPLYLQSVWQSIQLVRSERCMCLQCRGTPQQLSARQKVSGFRFDIINLIQTQSSKIWFVKLGQQND